jgi:hypothetical protein
LHPTRRAWFRALAPCAALARRLLLVLAFGQPKEPAMLRTVRENALPAALISAWMIVAAYVLFQFMSFPQPQQPVIYAPAIEIPVEKPNS